MTAEHVGTLTRLAKSTCDGSHRDPGGPTQLHVLSISGPQTIVVCENAGQHGVGLGGAIAAEQSVDVLTSEPGVFDRTGPGPRHETERALSNVATHPGRIGTDYPGHSFMLRN